MNLLFEYEKIAILGCGVTGTAVADFLSSRGICYNIFDENHKQDFVINQFEPNGTELVIFSPGFVNSSWLFCAQECGCKCLSEIDFAQFFYTNRTIAITGTNGKTSTAHMLAYSLKNLGQKCVLSGNIGNALIGNIDFLNANIDAWNICEISSFQAMHLQYFHPNYVLWTNFSENHCDVHKDMKEYWLAKLRLLNRCTGSSYVDRDIVSLAKSFGSSLPDNIHIVDDSTVALPLEDIGYAAFRMEHQRKNCQFVAELLINIGYDLNKITSSLRNFTTQSHRLAICATINGVDIWEDSKATTAAATIAALRHVAAYCRTCIWIACGRQKGCSMQQFLPAISIASEILCFGDVSTAFKNEFPNSHINYLPCKDVLHLHMRNFIKNTHPNPAAIVFSPGFASFDMFLNYAERGKWFREEVDLILSAK
jgi:UDP-N-acetylmuramoylalanine--D-glutamate ligase